MNLLRASVGSTEASARLLARVGVVGTKQCAVVKVCLVLSGESRPRWKKAGKTIR
jgi:hypothetical protein